MCALHFVFGDDPFQIEERGSQLRIPDAETVSFASDFKLEELAQSLQNWGLFSTNRVILIRNPWFLYKTVTDSDIATIQAQFESVGTDASLLVVILCTDKVDQRKKLVTWLKKNASISEYTAFKDWEQQKVVDWIGKRALAHGKKTQPEAAILLEQLHGTDLQTLANELEKLSIFIGDTLVITTADILATTGGTSGRIFQLTEGLKTRSLSKSLAATHSLLQAKEEPVKLLGLVASTVRLYLQCRLGIDAKLPLADLAKKIGKNPYFLKQIIPLVQTHYPLKELKRIYTHLAKTDTAIKSGQLSGPTAIELLVTRVCHPEV